MSDVWYTQYMVTSLCVVKFSIERLTVIVSQYMITDNSVVLLGAWLILATASEIFGESVTILPLFAVSCTSCSEEFVWVEK